jgi:hypothetical protein
MARCAADAFLPVNKRRSVLRRFPCKPETSNTVRAGAEITAELGHGEEAIPAMRHRVRASLQYLSREKRAVQKHGRGSKVTWSIAA